MLKIITLNRVEEMLIRLREKLASRGARGIIGLGKQFRIMDDNNSRSLELPEFRKAMRDYKLGFTESEIETLFKAFDINRDGTVNYDEFLRIIRGKMNDTRKNWVTRAFKVLDIDNDGVVTLSEIKQKYNAKMHPDVKAGKKAEDEVLKEFMDTFQTHHNIMMNKEGDDQVTAEEFEEYYTNVSASIDTDEYFALMMRNAWRFDEASRTYEKGWRGEEEVKAPRSMPPAGLGRTPAKKGQANLSSLDNMLKLQSEIGSGKKGTPSPLKKPAEIESFRKILATRGARGIIGLARQFRIADNDNSGEIDLNEFIQVIKDFRVPIDERSIRSLFETFDRDRSGRINYDEFLRGVRGEMNQFRQGLVELAFKKLDKDGSGVIDIKDLKGVYNARNHPDVRAGKRTEDQVLGEFLETFEMHKNLAGGKNDQIVTKEEFMEYYNNVSASIDDDKYFELVIVNAWKLYGEDAKKPGWTEYYTKSRPMTASQSAPFGTSEEPTDYSTALRPRRAYEAEEVKRAAPAGYPSWSKGVSPAKVQPASYTEKQLLDGFRQALLARGTRGLLNLQRAFRIIDDDNSMDLSLPEFKKVIKEYRLKYSEADAEKLFKVFDRDQSGKISYDEFIRTVVVRVQDVHQQQGEMNAFRRGLVTKAFKILDKDGSGEVTVEDIKETYSASKHPDVIARKKTEDEVLTEFLDTFELHYSLKVLQMKVKDLQNEGKRDAKVTLDEFMEYYNNVSASIDDDRYFELMMVNAWNMNKASYGRAWTGKYQRLFITHSFLLH
eukprot:TRINITY_DN2460_c0_g1_i1.p1 TRINITY_DN2460_c0_g1~~TRINITY_DN2460_c0_g1_i1.p1  ORF type:complete len:776 (+),score=94.21 TRINITY_DN2460_c0_g1_i1:7353-9680(+)